MAGNDLLDADLRDLGIVSGAGGVFLYASTGQNGGISVYRVDGPGGLANLSDSSYFSTSGITMGAFDVVDIDGQVRLVLGGTGNGALITYGVAGNGDLTGGMQDDLPGNGVETAKAAASAGLSNGTTALYMVDGDTGALAAYVSDGAGALVAQTGLTGTATEFDLDAVVALEVVEAGGVSYLVAASGADNGSVRSYRIDTDSGALEYIDSLGAENGLGIAAPSAMQTFVAYGDAWVILGAAGSSTLSVMRLAANGQLEPVDHILDTLATRFGGLSALEVVEVGGRVFVLAGGADDGLALFSLLPDGRLVHMQSLAQTAGAGLENVTGIEAVQLGNELRIFVSSGAAQGLSQFSLSLEDLGLVIQGANSAFGSQIQGTGAQDLLLGMNAQDQLLGQGGDDILVSAPGGSILTGGAGADTFVLAPTTGILQISDFEAGVDRLDLTGFAMLRSASQLDLTPTGNGITIEYGTTLIEILSNDGQSLNAGDLWPGGFDTPDRVPIPPGPVIRVTLGTAADDALTGGAAQDIIRGLGGDDQIMGMAGRDKLFGGKGGDQLIGGGGRDRLVGGGEADILRGGGKADTLLGGQGKDKLNGGSGGDTLRGGTGRDKLLGGSGADTLTGGAGADKLNGGSGADTLIGGAGRDQLNGGLGADILTGGAGRDVFVFSAGATGNDRISDFTDGQDLIRIATAGTTFGDLTLTLQGNDTVIDTGSGTITLSGVLPQTLSADDFLFF